VELGQHKGIEILRKLVNKTDGKRALVRHDLSLATRYIWERFRKMGIGTSGGQGDTLHGSPAGQETAGATHILRSSYSLCGAPRPYVTLTGSHLCGRANCFPGAIVLEGGALSSFPGLPSNPTSSLPTTHTTETTSTIHCSRLYPVVVAAG
jgi:hypothetical protein